MLIRYSFVALALWAAPALAQEPLPPEVVPDAAEPTAPPAAIEAAPAPAAEEIEAVEVVKAEDAEPDYYGEAYPVIERYINVMNGRTMRPGSVEVVVAHRTSVPIAKDPFWNYVGFDGGSLKVALGVRYGIIENLDAGVYRLNGTVEPFDVYEFDARYQLLHRERHFVDLALRLGGTWFARKPKGDESFTDAQALGYFAQAIASTVVAERFTLGGGVLFHSDSTGPNKRRQDTKPSLALAGASEIRLLPNLAWDLEMVGAVAGYHENIMGFSTGPKIITNRHTFAFVVSNTQYMSADGIVTDTPRGPKRWILGFNITREL